MEYINIWVKSIIYYVLFVKLILCLVPSGQMSKYIKLFTSILLILLIMKPIIELKNLDENIFQDILGLQSSTVTENLKLNANTYKEVNNQLALSIYKDKIMGQIEQIVMKENVHLNTAEIILDEDINSLNYGQIRELYLDVSKTVENSDVIIGEVSIGKDEDSKEYISPEEIIIQRNIKNALINFYNLNLDNIYINIDSK